MGSAQIRKDVLLPELLVIARAAYPVRHRSDASPIERLRLPGATQSDGIRLDQEIHAFTHRRGGRSCAGSSWVAALSGGAGLTPLACLKRRHAIGDSDADGRNRPAIGCRERVLSVARLFALHRPRALRCSARGAADGP